eukprot:TRINITY_DN20192_c0_g1_i1.p1 TRINITY_DN20192_c0_g1~~TRINITY_DN20192_c0_g1_i1.p1  ORF type:complete len:114 (+),score=34.27 TRINITY_DN20192_c0_g1_i1:82-423(+)
MNGLIGGSYAEGYDCNKKEKSYSTDELNSVAIGFLGEYLSDEWKIKLEKSFGYETTQTTMPDVKQHTYQPTQETKQIAKAPTSQDKEKAHAKKLEKAAGNTVKITSFFSAAKK